MERARGVELQLVWNPGPSAYWLLSISKSSNFSDPQGS